MRYTELSENKKEIEDLIRNLMREYFNLEPDDYTINPNGTVDALGDIKFISAPHPDDRVKKIPVRFGHVRGEFICSHQKLVSLAGCPEIIGEGFFCNDNKLTSLKGGPKKMYGSYYCNKNQLTSLAGAVEIIDRDFFCSDNQLTSLVGAPQYVGGNFYCYGNHLISLEGFPKEFNGVFCCDWSEKLPLLRTVQAKSGVSIKTPGTRAVHPTTDIINQFSKHTNLRHAILDCQKALIEAGYAGNARW
jgi:hypothetical protein